MNPNLHNVADLERIKELEAELTVEHGKFVSETNQTMRLRVRAEKAEAEVERLRSLSAGKPRESAANPAAHDEDVHDPWGGMRFRSRKERDDG